jgi:hypothetical protein
MTGGEDDGSRHDGPEEAAAADLVNARKESVALRAGPAFVTGMAGRQQRISSLVRRGD